MPISRIGQKITQALQDNKVSTREAQELITAAKSEQKWTPELKAEVVALLAKPGTGFDPAARASLQRFVDATPTQRDLPDPKVLTKHATNYAWAPVKEGKLFVDGVKLDDVAQGYIGDCYLAGALASVAQADPQAIKNAIKDNHDGTFTVRFFEQQRGGKMAPVAVTVDGDVPVPNGGGRAQYAHGTNDKELWPALVEKAYAQWKGGYDAIGNGGQSSAVMTALTGKPASYTANATMTADQVYARIKAAVPGHPVSAATFGEDQEKLYEGTGVHANHVYTVLGVVEEKGVKYVELRNPWGFSGGGTPLHPGKDDGSFKLPAKDFVKLYASTYWGG